MLSVAKSRFIGMVKPKYENKAKTKPFKAIFLDPNLGFKPKNKDFRQIYKNLFMQNKAIFQKLHSEYETLKKTKNAKRTQNEPKRTQFFGGQTRF